MKYEFTVKTLKEIASKLDIVVPKKITRAELINLIDSYPETVSNPEPDTKTETPEKTETKTPEKTLEETVKGMAFMAVLGTRATLIPVKWQGQAVGVKIGKKRLCTIGHSKRGYKLMTNKLKALDEAHIPYNTPNGNGDTIFTGLSYALLATMLTALVQ